MRCKDIFLLILSMLLMAGCAATTPAPQDPSAAAAADDAGSWMLDRAVSVLELGFPGEALKSGPSKDRADRRRLRRIDSRRE